MWYLECPNKGGSSYRLTKDKDQHQVSRTVGDITLNGDQSVSRKHAVLMFETDNSDKTVVIIKDLASKYGTYINGSLKLEPNKSHQLKDGDVITFGCQWNEWRFHSKPLVITTSTMSNEAKIKLRQIMSELGGTVVSDWQDSCSHLTMQEILLTAKVVCALASGIPIVTPEYWESFKASIDEKKLPPNYEPFIPPLKESVLNKNNVSFAVNENRRKLFSGKTFIFSSDKQLKKYKTIIVAAGGSCQALEDCDMTVDEFCESDVVVMQHVSNTDPQPPALYSTVLREMRDRQLKPIPESEIGLAVLTCSLDTYCNMKYNVIGSVLEGGVVMSQIRRAEILADDSQVSVNEPVKIKTEENGIKTEKQELAKVDTTPTPSVAECGVSTYVASGSATQQLNNEETLPCGVGNFSTLSGTSMEENASPSIAPGTSRKRPAAMELGEPPAKKFLSEEKVQELKEKNSHLIEDFTIGDGPFQSNTFRKGINGKGGRSCSMASKRKLDMMDIDELNCEPINKSARAKSSSEIPYSFAERPSNYRCGVSSLLTINENGEPVIKSGRVEPSSSALLSSFGEVPSTSKSEHSSVLNVEDDQWMKEGAKGIKEVVSANWGDKFKELDSKRPFKVHDFGVGMTVKLANLIVDTTKQKESNSPVSDPGPSVVNYKKFRKVKNAGSKVSLPVIIGESDLVPYTGGIMDF